MSEKIWRSFLAAVLLLLVFLGIKIYGEIWKMNDPQSQMDREQKRAGLENYYKIGRR